LPSTPTTRISGLMPEDRTALAARDLSSSTQIWESLAGNPELIDALVLAGATARTRVKKALAAQAKRESESITKNRFVAHLPDFILLILAAVVAAAVILVDRSPQVVVVAVQPLAPFHVIDATDLQVRYAFGDSEAKRELSVFVGRYPLTQLRAGEVIDCAKLSSGIRLAHELDGRRIFTLKIRRTSIVSGIRPPFRLDLFLSPRSAEERGKAQRFAVYLLDSKPDEDSLSVVVAATKDDSATLLSVRSAGDLIAVGPIQ
jgi:hypothetical protein